MLYRLQFKIRLLNSWANSTVNWLLIMDELPQPVIKLFTADTVIS
jgi:hypothetical protein